MKTERFYCCDNCRKVFGSKEESVPFQVGRKHYCNEDCARDHRHKSDEEGVVDFYGGKNEAK